MTGRQLRSTKPNTAPLTEAEIECAMERLDTRAKQLDLERAKFVEASRENATIISELKNRIAELEGSTSLTKTTDQREKDSLIQKNSVLENQIMQLREKLLLDQREASDKYNALENSNARLRTDKDELRQTVEKLENHIKTISSVKPSSNTEEAQNKEIASLKQQIELLNRDRSRQSLQYETGRQDFEIEIQKERDINLRLNRRIQDLEQSRESAQPTETLPSIHDEIVDLRERVHALASTDRPHIARDPESMGSVRDAVKVVPTYDGKEIPVLQFVKACKRAKEMSPPGFEPQLTRLIKGKLEGRAYDVIEGENFSSLEPLLDRLTEIFGPSRPVNYYRGELGRLYKEPSEHIIDYVRRTKDIHAAILESERRKRGYTDPMTEDEVEVEVIDGFLGGLGSEYRVGLQLEGYKSLNEAFNKAIELGNTFAREKERARLSRIANQAVRKCSLCHQVGHVAEDCFRRKPTRNFDNSNFYRSERNVNSVTRDRQRYGNVNGNQSQSDNRQVSRSYGHNSPTANRADRPPNTRNRDSRPDNNVNRSSDQRPICDYCQIPGHTADRCFKRHREETSRPISTAGPSRTQDQGNGQGPSGSRNNPRESGQVRSALPIRAVEGSQQSE